MHTMLQYGGLRSEYIRDACSLVKSRQSRSELSYLFTQAKKNPQRELLLNRSDFLRSTLSTTTEAMQANLLSIVSLMAFISCSRCGDVDDLLYPCGPNVGDSSLGIGINPGAYIELKESYPVFGRQFTKIYVSHKN